MGRWSARYRVLSSIVGGALLVAGTDATLDAQTAQRHIFAWKPRRVLEWTGRVHRDAELVITGRSFIVTRIGSPEREPDGSMAILDVPREDGELTVKTLEGRGLVEVAQQPALENGYTAVIRIRDPEDGTGTYKIEAYWQGAAAGEVVPYEKSEVESRPYAYRVALIWAGDIDENVEIVVRPSGITYETIRGKAPRALQSAISQLPFPNALLEITRLDGRGDIEVTQQPTVENGLTARVRIRDPQPGFGHYAFELLWK